jgi:hypothetical protein
LCGRKLALCGTYGKGGIFGRYRPVSSRHKVEKIVPETLSKAGGG